MVPLKDENYPENTKTAFLYHVTAVLYQATELYPRRGLRKEIMS
jgi:hypothetical protein